MGRRAVFGIAIFLIGIGVVYADTSNVTVSVFYAECTDGVDNDSDGKTDYPDDPGCSSASDDDETDSTPPQCSDGADNDTDGLTDYPSDPGCSSSSDDSEENIVSSGGGGGGGGSISVALVSTSATFSGSAFPLSTVVFLQNGIERARTVSGPDGKFTVTITNPTTGASVFSVRTTDQNGNISSLFNYPISLSTGTQTSVSGIFFPPTISSDKVEVKQGDNITFFGSSLPQANVTIQINSEETLFKSAKANDQGGYVLIFDSQELERGNHLAKSKSETDTISEYGPAVSFVVGDENIERSSSSRTCARGDLNCDGRVNLIDFSIAAFWYKRALNVDASQLEGERLNADGKMDIVDLSIMAFHWTG